MTTSTGQSNRPGSDRTRYRIDHSKDVQYWETASHEVEAAPSYVIFVGGMLDGRWQTIQVDPDEVDELARTLHKAKRHARSKR